MYVNVLVYTSIHMHTYIFIYSYTIVFIRLYMYIRIYIYLQRLCRSFYADMLEDDVVLQSYCRTLNQVGYTSAEVAQKYFIGHRMSKARNCVLV